ncbi:hypothetical protein COT78_01025 [Candidatus Berkelbacteria bacterium CG10_big_fil_rev_8_21_14_0_10_43_13]|uniref:Uncharacterized protein n=1 Tax=Candidatus Berkelbacteria bacterium CG10_big_fil_rev_8_21_14_0_10_43_13 TaxID=1974514 RepID=A0A2H0W980_9BACT|nr:MAG: hypothetical protein COT78_01025 [Candidatus Berkelbacteria bacterium CG10_big_fil_rev_8_21_14_0_10_43_13]
MSKRWWIVLIIVSFLVGLAGGAIGGYRYYPTKNKATNTKTTAESTTTTTENTTATDSVALETCLKAKWGESKYQAISANPSLASVDDKFNALPCYK